jgi:hemoglobin
MPSHEGAKPTERDSVRSADPGTWTTCSTVRGSTHRAGTTAPLAVPANLFADAAPTGSPPIRRFDLSTRAHVHDLVVGFYREIMLDELLEPIFGDVAEVDWVEHIPRLIDYWCWILLGTPRYAGTVTKTHRHLHSLQPLAPDHCDRWFSLWVHCVDERWDGRNAERAKSYAATMMEGLAKHVFGFTWARPATQDTAADSEPRPDLEVGWWTSS